MLKKLPLLFVFVLLATLSWTACTPTPQKVVVSPDNIQLRAAEATARLTAEALDEKGARIDGVTLTWTSADEGVAKVDATGTVRAVGSGETTVTARAGELSANVSVSVSIPSSLKLNKTELLLEDETRSDSLTASVLDEKNAPWRGRTDIKWKTEDENVATVDGTGRVTAAGSGTTTITATFKSLSVSAKVTSEVSPKDKPDAAIK